jgi:hypothetical protein
METRERSYDISLSCAFCGGIFTASRADAKYCSGAHRLAAHRKSARLKYQADNIQRQIDVWAVRAAATQDGRQEMVHLVMRMQAQLKGLLTRYDY